MILQIIITLITVAVVAFVVNAFEDANENKISFKETLDLVGIPIVTFSIGEKKLHFVLDTGANKSIINKKIADKLGATAENGTSKVVGIEGKAQDCYYTTLNLNYKDTDYQEKFQVMDMTATFKEIKNTYGVTLHGILGSSFMEKYKYVLNFEEMVAYSKKKNSSKK